jgi:hypothetical protein
MSGKRRGIIEYREKPDDGRAARLSISLPGARGVYLLERV